MGKFGNEIKTGTVIILAFLTGIFFWVRTTDFRKDIYRLKTYFRHAEGVEEDSIVKFAGIEVGRVEKVAFRYRPEDTIVELTLLLDRNAKVRDDSIAFIGTSGFIGDAYVGITSGEDGAFLKDGEVIKSEDPVEMREIMKRADKIARKLDTVLADMKGIISDNRKKIDNIIANLEDTTANFKEFSEDIKRHPWKLLMRGREKKGRRKR